MNLTPNLRGHLEAQITNVADELAYTSHDLDDGLRSGMITTDMLTGIELWDMVVEQLRLDACQLDDLTRHQIIRELIGIGSGQHDREIHSETIEKSQGENSS